MPRGERSKARAQAEALGFRWNIRRTHDWQLLQVCLDLWAESGHGNWPNGVKIWYRNLTDYKRPCRACRGSGITVDFRVVPQEWKRCPVCRGVGAVPVQQADYWGSISAHFTTLQKLTPGTPVLVTDQLDGYIRPFRLDIDNHEEIIGIAIIASGRDTVTPIQLINRPLW